MSTLINKNVVVAGHRTSMRLEPEMWDALTEICQREKCSISEICTLVDERRGTSSFTSAVRVFILTYFRKAVSNANASSGDGRLNRPDGAQSTNTSKTLEDALKEVSHAA